MSAGKSMRPKGRVLRASSQPIFAQAFEHRSRMMLAFGKDPARINLVHSNPVLLESSRQGSW